MKSTDNFKNVISKHLSEVAENDALFSETLKKENKTIDGCINYILNTVKKSGCSGFEDEEIFTMAIHYYDEDNLPEEKAISCNIVTNHKVTSTKTVTAPPHKEVAPNFDKKKSPAKKTHVEYIQGSLF